MTRDEWRHAELVATQALALAPEEQHLLLASANLTEPVRRELAAALRRIMRSSSIVVSSTLTPASSDSLGLDAPAATLPALQPRAEIDGGRFVVVRQIGRGGMGAVFLAQDTTLETFVALKVLPPDDRLIKEARRAAACSYHPNVATIHNVLRTQVNGQEIGVLVMEYVEGTPASRLLDDGPVDTMRVLRWMRQVADAIAHAHDHQVLHCDLKPANIIITPQDDAKVLDFGIARAMFDPADPSEPLRGTMPYMAPEQLIARDFSRAGDVYSLGVTLFELLSGTVPFDGDDAILRLRIVAAPPPRLSSRASTTPETLELESIVERALAKDPDDRYRSIRALKRELDRVYDQSQTGAADVAKKRLEWFLRRNLPRYLRAVGLVLVAGVSSGLLASWAFNVTLDRPRGFDPDSMLRQLGLGFQALVLPGVVIGTALGFVAVLQFLGGLMLRLKFFAALVRRARWVADEWHRELVTTMAIVVAAYGLAAIAYVTLEFADITDAFMARADAAAPDAFAPFHPGNLDRQVIYRVALSLLLVILLLGWRGVHAMAEWGRTSVPAGATAASFAVAIVLFILAQAPYKLLTEHAELPVALVEQNRCYVLGENASEARVYCPGWPVPRTRTVTRGTDHIQRCGFEENPFSGSTLAACQQGATPTDPIVVP